MVPPGIPVDLWIEVMRVKHLSDLQRADSIIERWNRKRKIAFAEDVSRILGLLLLYIIGNLQGNRRLTKQDAPIIMFSLVVYSA